MLPPSGKDNVVVGAPDCDAVLDAELLVEASALPVPAFWSVVTPVCKLVGTVPATEDGTIVPLANVYGPVWVSA